MTIDSASREPLGSEPEAKSRITVRASWVSGSNSVPRYDFMLGKRLRMSTMYWSASVVSWTETSSPSTSLRTLRRGCVSSSKRAITACMKNGRSAGLREVTRLWSITTGSSCHLAPALRRSSRMASTEVTVLPARIPAEAKTHPPWQMEATRAFCWFSTETRLRTAAERRRSSGAQPPGTMIPCSTSAERFEMSTSASTGYPCFERKVPPPGPATTTSACSSWRRRRGYQSSKSSYCLSAKMAILRPFNDMVFPPRFDRIIDTLVDYGPAHSLDSNLQSWQDKFQRVAPWGSSVEESWQSGTAL